MRPSVRLRSGSAVALAAALLLAGCGGSSEKADVNPNALLDSAFSHPIPTSQTGVDFKFDGQGAQQLQGPVEVKLDGPYISGKGMEIPSVDWDVNVDLGGLGVDGAVTSTGDNAFIELLGATYEVGAARVAAVNKSIVAATQAAGGHPQPLANLGVHPRTWFKAPEYVGDDDVDGVTTRHIHAELDAPAVVDDIHALARKVGVQGSGAGIPVRLSPGGRKEVEDGIKSSAIDVWIGADDEIVRRLKLAADFTIPPSQRATVGGLESGVFSLDVLQTDVGEDKSVSAPPPPYSPLDELLGNLPPIPGLSGG